MKMGSDRIYEEVEAIGSVGGRREKERLLKINGDFEDFYLVMRLAYDPFVRFGIASLPKAIDSGDEQFDERTASLLEHLSKRKLTGNAAYEAVLAELSRLTPASQELLKRVILKDMRAGFTAKTLNTVKKGWVPVFECMLAHKFEDKRATSWPLVAEPKLDGVRVLALVQGDAVEFVSRTGKEFTSFDHLKEPVVTAVMSFIDRCPEDSYVREWSGVVIDGEMVSGTFNKTVSEVRKKEVAATDAVFNVFDLLPLDLFRGEMVDRRKYSERRALLEDFVQSANSPAIKLVPRYFVNSVDEIQAIYGRVRDRGLEGLIVKHPAHLYELKRSYGWLKMKNEETHDLIVTGRFEGTGKYEGMLGGLICDFNGVEVRVGGGFTDEQRREIWAAPEAEVVGRMIEVEAHERTPDGSLRHPRFLRWRDDKHDAEAA